MDAPMPAYQPPFQITSRILRQVAAISELIGRWSVVHEGALSPQLRRENRIRTIHASLAIENNTLSLDQVTAVFEGKRVMGLPREIQEVRNAILAYEQMDSWTPHSSQSLLGAHQILMSALVDRAGVWRQGGVGIYRGDALVHMAPPASQVPRLIDDLTGWLGTTDTHPLIASCVFHYEFEFIHPFEDGNGRMGRLWQTLILSRWQPFLAHLPVESLVLDRQADYYSALSEADKRAEATVFVEFMLQAILDAMSESEAISSEKSSEIVIDLLVASPSMSARELASKLEMTPRGVEKILARLREQGLLERIGGAKNGYWLVKVKKS
jgi:Fic family protein